MNVACPQCTSVFRVDPAKVPPGGVRARCSVCSGIINVPEPSFEEPVAATPSSGWPGGQDSSWGRVPTPEGGWTATRPAGPPTAPASPTPPAAIAPPQHTSQPGTAWPSPSGSIPATWGDWPSPDAGASQEEQPANPWGDYGANPLVPEMFSAPVQPPPFAPEAPRPPDYTPPAPEPAAESWQSEPADEYADEYQEELPAAQESASAVEQPAETPSPAGSHINPFLRRDPHERARRLARALASDIVTYYPEKHAEGMRDGTLRELFREEIKKSYDDYVAHVGAELARSTNYFQEALNEVVAGGKRLF